MKILMIGGTQFLGRHIVEAALKSEQISEIVLFHRGKTNPDLFPELEHIHGDRRNAEDLEKLRGRSFDAVIDTSAYFPKDVELLLDRLADTVDHYTFVSSISVYSESGTEGPDEESPVGELTESMSQKEITHENYGPLKVAAERKGEELMPGRVLVIRPGLIVGPNDPTDRFTYWPWRIEQGGAVAAPGDPTEPVQFIDVRDLAEWTVEMIERKETGVFNATGPKDGIPIGEFLAESIAALDSDAELCWISEENLAEHNVAPFMEMPLWIPAEQNGMNRSDVSRAVAAGLNFRPVAETVRETLEWFRTTDRYDSGELRAGLKREREEEVLGE